MPGGLLSTSSSLSSSTGLAYDASRALGGSTRGLLGCLEETDAPRGRPSRGLSGI